MQDEMRTHLELYQADLRRRGVPEEEARRRALAEFGSVAARKEECRDAVGLRLLDELRGDVSYAFRLLRRSPAFTLVALLSLGLGIGANTAIFSLIDTVLVKTLPVEDPQRLVLRRQLRREVGRQQRPAVSVLRAAPGSQPLSLGYRGVRRAHVQGVDRRRAGAGARPVRLRLLLRRARRPRGPRTNAHARGRFRAWPRRPTWRGRRDQRRLLDAPLRKGSGGAREERSGRHAVGDHRRRHATGILRAPGRRAARHHASDDARRTGSAIEAELVAERDRASRARRERRGGARGSRGAVGHLLDGSRDASRQARLLQRHRARARGQRRERAAPAPTRSR